MAIPWGFRVLGIRAQVVKHKGLGFIMLVEKGPLYSNHLPRGGLLAKEAIF